MEEGRAALAAGEGERAQRSFGTALLIDPGNQAAERLLERAKNIETVMRLVESGKHHEQNNEDSLAYADYQEAVRLDPESDEAAAALHRLQQKIAKAQFRQHMSSGFAAFHDHQYERARTAFLKASALNPGSVEARDGLAQVDQAIRVTRIEALKEKALGAERVEDWEGALESYAAALKLDATIQFAVLGKARCLARIRLTKQLDLYLEKPDLLESDRHLESAVLMLKEASQVEPKGPRLSARIQKLDRLIDIAQTRVRVTLDSDNLTEVAVYRVGRLGRFLVRDLDLRPGTYTVVGSRVGYKDVRQKIVVEPGRAGPRVTVKCRERI
jgi:tetratricopeptide (TPR) repeat protein